MPKRKNYYYRSQEDIIKESNRLYHELLQDNKNLKDKLKKIERIAVNKHNSVCGVTQVMFKMLEEFFSIKNNIIIARNSKAELRDFYIDKTLYGLDKHIGYLENELKKLHELGYVIDVKDLIEGMRKSHTLLPIDLLSNDK